MTEEQNKYNSARSLHTYSTSHVGEKRGETYDKKMYAGFTYSNAVWQLEKTILDKIIGQGEFGTYLDFACGTGRVTSYLEERFQESYGIDISEDMLKVAKGKLRKTELLIKDITKDNLGFLANKFNVITCFRFFLNAESELKDRVMTVLAKLVKGNGCIIFNIHQHTFSLNYLVERIRRILNGAFDNTCNWMSIKDVKALVDNNGLVIDSIYSYTVLPRFFMKILPFKWWFFIEKKSISRKKYFGSQLIVVCRKANT